MQARAIAHVPAVPLVRALAQLHDLIALVASRSGELLFASEALTRLCGVRAPSEAHWLEALAGGTAAGDVAARLAATGQLAGEPLRLRASDGRLVSARASAARLDAAGCDVTAVIFRLEEHRRSSNAFRSRVDALSAVLDGVPDGVVVLDRNRFIAWANPALAAMTGYDLSELIDQPFVLFLHGREDIERIAASEAPLGPGWREELEISHRDGSPLAVLVEARPLRLPDGSELGTVAYVRDVTERRRIEGELARRAEELQSWVNTVSHDLRSPLVAVLGFARLLRDDYGDRLDDQGLRFLRRIEEAGRTMESLVQDLLEFARLGRREPKRVQVDPREVLLQLQAELKPRLEDAKVDLRLPPDLPLLWCDRTQLYQVMSNLVGNALDHAGPSPHPVVEVNVFAEDRRDHITVRDWGRGIDPAHHERIFEIFQTHSAPGHGRHGTGIGLAIVRKIADSHGGAAWVESHPGEGSTFHVTFARA